MCMCSMQPIAPEATEEDKLATAERLCVVLTALDDIPLFPTARIREISQLRAMTEQLIRNCGHQVTKKDGRHEPWTLIKKDVPTSPVQTVKTC